MRTITIIFALLAIGCSDHEVEGPTCRQSHSQRVMPRSETPTVKQTKPAEFNSPTIL